MQTQQLECRAITDGIAIHITVTRPDGRQITIVMTYDEKGSV